MSKKFIFLIFVLILLVPAVFGAGTCELDRSEAYLPGEVATFACSCTLPNEENQAGFIVWQNDTHVLQSVAVDSGSCRTNFFGGSYIFLAGSNYTGNVTFSLNADGTGDPTNWDGVLDIRTDYFNVKLSDEFRCLISDVKIPPVINLGRLGANSFTVTDSITNIPLDGAICNAIAYAADGSPVVVEPQITNPGVKFKSDGSGEATLYADFDNFLLNVDTTYEFRLTCSCYNNTDDYCIYNTNGQKSGYKHCSIAALFTTGPTDYRNQGNILSIVFTFIVIILVASGIGYFCLRYSGINENKTAFWFSLFTFGIAIFQFIFLIGIIYLNEIGYNLSNLLYLNWIVLGFVTFLGTFITMIIILMRIFGWDTDETFPKKW